MKTEGEEKRIAEEAMKMSDKKASTQFKTFFQSLEKEVNRRKLDPSK